MRKIRNPKPEIRNPKFETRNSKPETSGRNCPTSDKVPFRPEVSGFDIRYSDFNQDMRYSDLTTVYFHS